MCPVARAVTVYTPPCLPPSFTPSLPPCLPPFSRGWYRRTCTSLLRYKVSFHLLTEVTGFPCIQHRGKRTHWGWIVPDYLRGGCSLSMQHGEGQEAVGGFYQDLIWQLCLSFFFFFFWKKFAILSTVAGFISLYDLFFSSQPLLTSHMHNLTKKTYLMVKITLTILFFSNWKRTPKMCLPTILSMLPVSPALFF